MIQHEVGEAYSGVTFRPFMNVLVQVDTTNHGLFARRGREQGEHLQNNGTAIKIELIPFQTKRAIEQLQES
jgi:hypothetical protein